MTFENVDRSAAYFVSFLHDDSAGRFLYHHGVYWAFRAFTRTSDLVAIPSSQELWT